MTSANCDGRENAERPWPVNYLGAASAPADGLFHSRRKGLVMISSANNPTWIYNPFNRSPLCTNSCVTEPDNMGHAKPNVINMKQIARPALTLILASAAAAGCSPTTGSGGAVAFPTDAQINTALQAQFAADAHSAAARDLIRTLGGEDGRLRYQIHHVIYRQGAYEVRYDAVLVMGQPGDQSLLGLYATLIPEADRAGLAKSDIDAQEAWLARHAQVLGRTNAAQGQTLANTLQVLRECYRGKQTGAEVTVMRGLAALISPERNGLYAEKLASADATAHCLPA